MDEEGEGGDLEESKANDVAPVQEVPGRRGALQGRPAEGLPGALQRHRQVGGRPHAPHLGYLGYLSKCFT